MSGFCSAHRDHDPDCPRCGAVPYELSPLDSLQELESKATRPHPIYSGYHVGMDGSVWSVSSNWRGYGPRPLASLLDKNGYSRVRLTVDGRRFRRGVHQLVAETYLGSRAAGQEVRHLDGNKTNNGVFNLWYGTAKDNARDRAQHDRTAKGSLNGEAVLTERIVAGMRTEYAQGGITHLELARRYGVSRTAIGLAINRKSWRHV